MDDPFSLLAMIRDAAPATADPDADLMLEAVRLWRNDQPSTAEYVIRCPRCQELHGQGIRCAMPPIRPEFV